MKENKKINKYKDPARVITNMWNMKVIVIPTVVRVLGTAPKWLEEELGELETREKSSKSSRLQHF